MTASARAAAIAGAARHFPWLGDCTAHDLLALVRAELGDIRILDELRPHGAHHARAVAPRSILHVLSGNTPHAALQSIMRGLLLGSHNHCKLPSAGLPEVEAFRSHLPPELAARIEIAHEVPGRWLEDAGAIVVFGGDDAVADLRARARPDQIFIAHGHRISLAIVHEDPNLASVPGAARDASLFDQQGCLSPHAFYVRETGRLTAPDYAGHLARAMDAVAKALPRGSLSLSEHASIRELRAESRFRQSAGEPVQVWESADGTDWTVIFDAEPAFVPSILNRVVHVRPLPEDLPAVLAPVSQWISTVAVWPVDAETADLAARCGASRICPVGRMQAPPLTWHQDGIAPLASLVRWIDLESGA